MEDILLYFSLKYDGDFHKILKALQEKEKVTQQQITEAKATLKTKYTTLISDDYPESLKAISAPPFVLFYKGNLSILNRQTISINGTLNPSHYGIECTEKYAEELANKNLSIITGLQKGIGTVALKKLIDLDMSNHAVAVLPCGIEKCYPTINKEIYDKVSQHGLVISEYPSLVECNKSRIFARLRLTSGLSDKLIITESKSNHKSSSMMEVGYILDQGKDVYVVPSNILEKDYQGNNELIKNGAYVTIDPNDIGIDQTLTRNIINEMEKEDIDLDI